MKTNRKFSCGQLFLLSILLVIFLVSVTMIFLGATVFRSQLPFFQLVDGSEISTVVAGPKPATFPGVMDLEVPLTTRLFLVMGTDFRPEAGFRTDVIMLVALDTLSGKVSLVSFPRDLWVTIPGYYEQRINTVMQIGGIQLMANTMQANFGIYPADYAMIDMAGFLNVIDVLGGITFETEFYTADACDSSLDPDRWCEVGPGTVTLDKNWALWYVRARYNSSDFDRMRRTQEVVKAVMKKTLSPIGLLKLPSLMRIYQTEVQSNINPIELLPLSRLAIGFNPDEDVRNFTIGPNEASGFITGDGAAVLIPNIPAIQVLLQEALNFK